MAIKKLLSNANIGLVVDEVTAGTYVDPTVADIKLYDLEPIVVEQSSVRVGNEANGSFKKGKYLSGTKIATTSFKAALQSSGTPTVAPVLGKLFSACGGVEYTDTNIGYRWDGTPTCNTVSFKTNLYDCGSTPEGFAQAMRGASGTMTISAENVGAPIVCTFNLTGAAVPEVDIVAGAPTVPSGFDTADCEKLLGVTTTVNGSVHKVQGFSATFNIVVTPLMDAASAEGVVQVAITDADPVLSITVINTGITPEDFYGAQASDTTFASITMVLANWDFTFTNSQVLSIADSDASGFAVRAIEFPFETFEMIQK